MWTRSELKTKAKMAFRSNYLCSVLAGLIIMFFTGGAADVTRRYSEDSVKSGDSNVVGAVIAAAFILSALSIVAIVIKVIIGNALLVGSSRLFIDNENSGYKPDLDTILFVFREGHIKNVVSVLFVRDMIVFLFTLLLIFPGIIKSYEYCMVDFLLADNPEMSRPEALERSKMMMYGHKWNAFVLDLSFFGWFILNAFTFNLLQIFWINPYMCQTHAELYLKLQELDNNYSF